MRHENKKFLDMLWEKAHRHASAASYMNSSNPGLPAMISIMVGMQKELQDNRQKLEKLEEKIECSR